ncbi:phosphatidylinositol-3,5-bisphosphate 5-phosphatase, partial [Massospora cicadina]
ERELPQSKWKGHSSGLTQWEDYPISRHESMNSPSSSPPRGYYHYAQPSSNEGCFNKFDLNSENVNSSPTPPSVHSAVDKTGSGQTPSSVEASGSPTSTTAPDCEFSPPTTEQRTILHQFTIYETKTRLYVVGSNFGEDKFRILKVDRTSPKDLILTADEVIYSNDECIDLLSRIDMGNRSAGGLTKVMSAFGLVGFVKFHEGYYLCVITKRKAIALIGGHYIYHLEGTSLLNVTSAPHARVDRHPDEARYLGIFQNMDLSKNFYFSYTYDLTYSLQHNVDRFMEHGRPEATAPGAYQERFVWNHHLLTVGFGGDCLSAPSDWVLPLIHGFVDQAEISVFGRSIHVTLIARRSRHFAGTRFLKRGANNEGHVANDVETEQIVHDVTLTPLFNNEVNPNYTSYLQHRGSIPLAWGQDTSTMAPKPPIHIARQDPFASMAALHFSDLFRRYGAPVVFLNLIKAKEKTPRESRLLKEFTSAVKYLTACLPDPTRLVYVAWDMSRASKSPDQDVIAYLEELAEDALAVTGFFHSGPEPYAWSLQRGGTRYLKKRQEGIVRTNCIDCIDRTNAAQFLIGKCALAHQLHALGVVLEPHLPFDCDAVDMLTEMYHDHGDTLALQYGGSNLVNTMATYRNINQNWTSHSRDIIEAIRRFYTNSFVDAEKQEAMNLFLGKYIPGVPKLWDLTTDYYLHNPPSRHPLPRPHYIRWWVTDSTPKQRQLSIHHADDYWHEYYCPHAFTSLSRLLAFNINSTTQIRQRAGIDAPTASPFTIHVSHTPLPDPTINVVRFGKWFSLTGGKANKHKPRISIIPSDTKPQPKDPNLDPKREPLAPAASELSHLVASTLTPQISSFELTEYESYVSQFQPTSPSHGLDSEPPFNDGDSTEWDPTYHPDYQHFQKHLSAALGKFEACNPADYEAYAALPGALASNGFLPSPAKLEAYTLWLRTGRYRPTRANAPKPPLQVSATVGGSTH